MRAGRKSLLVVVAVMLLAGAAVFAVKRAGERGVEVRVEQVGERDLISTITATGNVRARRQVNISSDEMGRVAELNVSEGDHVEVGQVLLRLDPSPIEASVSRARAALSQAEAQVTQQRASLRQAEAELDRVRVMRDSGLVSVQALQEAETRWDVQRSVLESVLQGANQARAGLEEAQERLGRTTIRAPIAGRVTRLNIQEGETAIVGTMNNPGSLLLTISDLSGVEAVLSVDETDIPRVSIGDSARVEIDAFPGRSFSGRVTKLGNSAIRSSGNPSAPPGASVNFEVVLELLDPPEGLRPDLSATADVIVESRTGALAVPIISVTVRDRPSSGNADRSRDPSGAAQDEGVFVVQGGVARFRPIELGITGREHFEVISGLSAGDSVVSGPFQRIQELRDGQAVRVVPVPDGGG
jgi:HlyD family secretion protein